MEALLKRAEEKLKGEGKKMWLLKNQAVMVETSR